MRKGLTAALVAALAAAGSARVARAQTADEVIEKHITAMGGRAAHARIRSRSASGAIALATPAGDVIGTIEILNEVPNKARALVQIDLTALGAGQAVIDQRFDGVSGYVLDSLQGNHEITGNQLETMRAGAFPSPLLNYKQLGATVRLAEKEKVGDRDAFVLVYEPTSGSPTRHFIDAETYLLLKSVVRLDVPQVGGEIEQSTSFADYRDVDGIKAPFEIRTSSTVQNFTVTIAKVEHNVKIDESLFSKPAPK